MVPIQNLAVGENGTLKLLASTYQEAFGVCPTERFAQEHTGMMCSGFLVAPDLLVTAGHCIREQAACDQAIWVFEYQKDGSPITLDQVVRCKEIVEQVLDPVTLKLDYAVIRLDRKVLNRKPLAFRKEGKINEHEDVLVIGHPMGLPQKIADGANLRENVEPTYFTANLDTYGGNSGSPVFNANTGVVEGILVEGEMDLTVDETNLCYKSNVCPADGCLGEKVTRITSVAVLKNL
ncbi:MAG: serine protease [Bacteriovoracaceae bacterium]